MKNNFILFLPIAIIGVGLVIFLNNGKIKKEPVNNINQVVSQQTPITEIPQKNGKCKPEAVTLEGYGDKGKKLENCFVEYPGEPTRQDKSYYVLEDICGQFTKEFVENALGKSIAKIAPSKIDGLFNCSYFLNDKDDYVMLVFEYLSIANQKKGHEMAGRKTEESTKIPMRNLVVWQSDGLLNSIYLVFDDKKFISIERTSTSGLTSDKLINFAANMAKEIKNYK